MRQFHILLLHHCVVHSGINLLVPSELLDLLYGHSFINGGSCQCSSKLMRMHLRYQQPLSKLTQPYLHAADLQPLKRGAKCNEKGRIAVCAAIKVILKMYLRPGIEVDQSLLAYFNKYHTFPLVEVDVIPVECYHFAHTHT